MADMPVRLDNEAVRALIPHRPPILLIDEVLIEKEGERATGIRDIRTDEPVFEGHFPAQPILPGVYTVEAMAQTAAVLAMRAMGEEQAGKPVYFMTIEAAKFRKMVTPGDTLELHVTKDRSRGPVWRFSGLAKVGGQVVAEARFSAMLGG